MIERWRKAGLLWPAIAALTVGLVLVSLGTWQLQRKAWKEQLISQITARSSQPPAILGARIFATGPDQAEPYLRVQLTGRLLHDKERFWFADGREGLGFHVFTPLELAPTRVVWIDRGYIPARLKDPSTRIAGQVAGQITVVGLVHLPGEHNSFTPANDVAHNVWYWRDLSALNASAFTLDVISGPVMVDAEAAPANPGGWPEGGAALAALPNRHLEYVVTWYGLAATLIGVFFAFTRGRLKAQTAARRISVNDK